MPRFTRMEGTRALKLEQPAMKAGRVIKYDADGNGISFKAEMALANEYQAFAAEIRAEREIKAALDANRQLAELGREIQALKAAIDARRYRKS